MATGAGGRRLFEGGDYFKYFRHRGAIIRGRRLFKIFPSKVGDYSREAINQGTAIVRGEFVKTHENDFFGSQYVRKFNSWGWVRLALTVLLDVTTPFKFNTFL